MNSSAKLIKNLIANKMNSAAKATNCTANGTKSIAKKTSKNL